MTTWLREPGSRRFSIWGIIVITLLVIIGAVLLREGWLRLTERSRAGEYCDDRWGGSAGCAGYSETFVGMEVRTLRPMPTHLDLADMAKTYGVPIPTREDLTLLCDTFATADLVPCFYVPFDDSGRPIRVGYDDGSLHPFATER